MLTLSLKSQNIPISILYIEYIREKVSSIKGKYQGNNEILTNLDEYLKKIVEIHNFLTRSNQIDKRDPNKLNDFIMNISEIRDSLSEMLAKNISQILDDKDSKNANS